MFTISIEGPVGHTLVQLCQFDVGNISWKNIKSLATRFLQLGEFRGDPVTLVRVFVPQNPLQIAHNGTNVPADSFKENPPNWVGGWHYDFI